MEKFPPPQSHSNDSEKIPNEKKNWLQKAAVVTAFVAGGLVSGEEASGQSTSNLETNKTELYLSHKKEIFSKKYENYEDFKKQVIESPLLFEQIEIAMQGINKGNPILVDSSFINKIDEYYDKYNGLRDFIKDGVYLDERVLKIVFLEANYDPSLLKELEDEGVGSIEDLKKKLKKEKKHLSDGSFAGMVWSIFFQNIRRTFNFRANIVQYLWDRYQIEHAGDNKTVPYNR